MCNNFNEFRLEKYVLVIKNEYLALRLIKFS